MFRSAALKLTGYYLLIIMAISLIFSTLIYRISSFELDRGIRHPEDFSVLSMQDDQRLLFTQAREARIAESQQHLRENLIVLNLSTLALGTIASYILARRTLRPIEEAMEAQIRFTADASHELRTPLAAMQTEIEVGLRNPKLNTSDATILLKSALEEVGKLQHLSEGLLRLARGDGAITLNEAVELREIVTDAVSQLKTAASMKEITIHTQLKTAPVMGDSQALKEVIVILLDNAIKYSGEKTTIKVTLSHDAKQAMLTVQDKGVGIADADLPYIFERFYRGDVSRTKSGTNGYGLGLSIAKKIVTAHKGTMSATSTVGKGSQFSVYLPLADKR
jgi:two-component system, OmpR family, sensor histidine kinase CiaH